MSNHIFKGLLGCFLFIASNSLALEPTAEPTPEVIDPTQLKLPDGVLQKYLVYPGVYVDDSEKLDNWQLESAYLVHLENTSFPQLIVTARGYHGDESGAGVFVFDKSNKNGEWNFIGFKDSGEYATVRFQNIDGHSGPLIILDGGVGNHSKYLSILAVRQSKLVSLGYFEGYGYGIAVTTCAGKTMIINYHYELPDVCEACQSYYPGMADFDGNSFVAKTDDFVECLNSNHWKKGKESESADRFLSVLQKRPNLFGALVQAEYFTREAGRIEEADRLVERIKALKPEDLTYPCEPAYSHDNKLKYLKEKGWLKTAK
jgi:hypothetical protein